MGQKVNPISMRLQVNKDWRSKWFVDKRDYAKFLQDDLEVRRLISKKLGSRAAINKVEIARTPNLVTITIATAKAGVVIGRGGSGAEELKAVLVKITGSPVKVSIEEVKKPELSATLVAENIAGQLERRIAFRRAIKMGVDNVMKAGALGAKITVAVTVRTKYGGRIERRRRSLIWRNNDCRRP